MVMPSVPYTQGGVTRLVWVAPFSENQLLSEAHRLRRIGAVTRRAYYEGQEYMALNHDTLKGLNESGAWTGAVLPEHHRKHHYADQVGDGIDFLADQVSGGMILRSAAEDEDVADAVSEWITDLLKKSGLDNREQETVKEILITGDLLAYIPPDHFADPELGEPSCRIELWEAESMEVDYEDDDWQKMKEVRLEHLEETLDTTGEPIYVVTIRRFQLLPQLQPDGTIRDECTERVYHLDATAAAPDPLDENDPVRTIRHGLPFLPFVPLHGEFIEMRSMWGKSVITELLMQTADRYNSVCQLEYLAARYNATAKMVVTGDWAAQTLQDEVIATDVADVLTLPGGNTATSVHLPTDTKLLDANKDTLVDSMFNLIGLQRLDGNKIQQFGELSGYALEILNRKTDGTFRRIVGNLTTGYREIMEMAFNVDSYSRGRVVVEELPETLFDLADSVGLDVSNVLWYVDDDGTYPNGDTFEEMWADTSLQVDFGSGYVVDEVAVRDDYNSEIISRREALRQKRYSEDDIDRIVEEIENEDTATSLDDALVNGTRFDLEQT